MADPIGDIWRHTVMDNECWTWSGAEDIARFGGFVLPRLREHIEDLLRDAERFRWLIVQVRYNEHQYGKRKWKDARIDVEWNGNDPGYPDVRKMIDAELAREKESTDA